MICPKCKKKNNTKNGTKRGKQRYICKCCKATFYENSSKNFPRTSTPFPFIAFILYKWERYGIEGNRVSLLKMTEHMMKITTLPKKELHRSTIYSWKYKYGHIYKSLISEEETIHYYYKNVGDIKITRRIGKSLTKKKIKKTNKEIAKEKRKIRLKYQKQLIKDITPLFNKEESIKIAKDVCRDLESIKRYKNKNIDL